LRSLRRRQIGFNYLGRFCGELRGRTWARCARGGEGLARAAMRPMPLAHCIEVNALTIEDAEGAKLTAHWSMGAGGL